MRRLRRLQPMLVSQPCKHSAPPLDEKPAFLRVVFEPLLKNRRRPLLRTPPQFRWQMSKPTTYSYRHRVSAAPAATQVTTKKSLLASQRTVNIPELSLS